MPVREPRTLREAGGGGEPEAERRDAPAQGERLRGVSANREFSSKSHFCKNF
jgi:hypothetical protein